MSEVKTNKISSLASNNDITIDPDGTGDTIIASGNVGIGTASPTSKIDANGHIRVTGGTDCDIEFQNGAGRRKFIGGDSNDLELGTYSSSNTSRDVHMSIDSSGNFHINNNTADSNAFNQGLIIYGNNQGGGVGGAINGNNEHALLVRRSNSNGGIVLFRRDSSNVGSISVTTSATAYNTSSDYRLKENIDYTWDATTRLKQLKPARFNFIADADTTVDGFLAHEVSSIVPEAVTGTHNEVDDDGNPVMQGIDQSKLVPLLVKTIQELEARIMALEAE